jgi:glycerol-3-phosphate acyltransferase PlsY
VVTGIFDVGKGAVAVFTAQRLLGFPEMKLIGLPQAFVLAVGLAAVAGHVWSVYLRFTGGNGLSPTIGALAILMPEELLWALAATVVLAVITRNIVLSVNISLLVVVPLFAVIFGRPWPFIVFLVILILMLVLHFIPDIKAASVKAGSRERLFDELLRAEKVKKGKARRKG